VKSVDSSLKCVHFFSKLYANEKDIFVNTLFTVVVLAAIVKVLTRCQNACILLMSLLIIGVMCQIRDFAAKLNNYITSSVVYFKSQWLEIRSNAATLVGECQTSSTVSGILKAVTVRLWSR